MKNYLRDLRAEAIEALKETGPWVVAGVATSVRWPRHPQIVPFEVAPGQKLDFILRPRDATNSATISFNAQKNGKSINEGRDLILRFGSALAWGAKDTFEVFMWTGGIFSVGVGRFDAESYQEFLDPQLLPAIPSDDAATALAFYREGLAFQDHAYAFLSFFKVIAFVCRDPNGKSSGKKRAEWIKKTLAIVNHPCAPTYSEDLARPEVVNRLKELDAQGVDASTYLWTHGRNAIAHAEDVIFFDPNRSVDFERIDADLPVIQALARRAIAETYGIHVHFSLDAPKKSLIKGFEDLFGPDIVKKFEAARAVNIEDLTFPDAITAVARHENDIKVLAGLYIAEAKQVDECLEMKLETTNGSIPLYVAVDFISKKLLFTPERHAKLILNPGHYYHRFSTLRDLVYRYLENGHLELWNEETEEMLGQSRGYQPTSVPLTEEGLIDAERDTHHFDLAAQIRMQIAAASDQK